VKGFVITGPYTLTCDSGFPLDLSLVTGPSPLTHEKSCKLQLRLELEDYIYFMEEKNEEANFVNYSAFIAKIVIS